MNLRLLFTKTSRYYKFYLINKNLPQHLILNTWIMKRNSTSIKNVIAKLTNSLNANQLVELLVAFPMKKSANAKLLLSLLKDEKLVAINV